MYPKVFKMSLGMGQNGENVRSGATGDLVVLERVNKSPPLAVMPQMLITPVKC